MCSLKKELQVPQKFRRMLGNHSWKGHNRETATTETATLLKNVCIFLFVLFKHFSQCLLLLTVNSMHLKTVYKKEVIT